MLAALTCPTVDTHTHMLDTSQPRCAHPGVCAQMFFVRVLKCSFSLPSNVIPFCCMCVHVYVYVYVCAPPTWSSCVTFDQPRAQSLGLTPKSKPRSKAVSTRKTHQTTGRTIGRRCHHHQHGGLSSLSPHGNNVPRMSPSMRLPQGMNKGMNKGSGKGKSFAASGNSRSSLGGYEYFQRLPPERVLNAPKPPTLAQRKGLVKWTAPDVSAAQWQELKHKSEQRSDSKQPCCICKEHFDNKQPQVLLSCSHVFHKACLSAYERHSGQKTCPLCRQANYQMMLINDGAKEHYQRSATQIQALYRGHRVRKKMRPILEQHMPLDSGLRQKWHAKRMSKVSDKLAQHSASRVRRSQ